MATIFNVLGPRHEFSFKAKTAVVYGQPQISVIDGYESFTVEFSSGGPITIDTLAAPYPTLSALQADWQAQIDGAVGAGVGAVVNIFEASLAFADIANSFVEVSDINETNDFYTLRMPNISRDTTVSLTDIQPQNQFIGSLFPPYNFPFDILSDMYAIPRGANSISFYYELNSVVNDGYSQSAQMYICWTNGIDGYVVDGYYTEIKFATVNKYTDAEFDATLKQSGSFIATKSIVPVGYVLGAANDTIGLTTVARGATPPIDIPIGATGCYVAVIVFGTDNLVPNPPEVNIVAIAGTG